MAPRLKSRRTLTSPTVIVGCMCVTRRPYQRFHTLEAHGIVRPYPFKEITMPTLEQIQEKMKKLQVQADTLIAKKAQAAVDQIRKIMLAHGLTTVDIEVKAKAKREAKAANGSTPYVKAKVARSLNGGTPPKYQHPKTGATWTGHGRAPAWIADTKDRSKFLADAPGGNETDNLPKAAGRKISASNAVASSGQPKGAQPAKYLNR